MLVGIVKKIIGGFFPYVFDKNIENITESKIDAKTVLETNSNYNDKQSVVQKKFDYIKDDSINNEKKNDIEEALISLFNKSNSTDKKLLEEKNFNLKSHRNMFYNTNYWEKLKSKLSKNENTKQEILKFRDERIENKILENKKLDQKIVEEKLFDESKNKIEKVLKNNLTDKDTIKRNVYSSFGKFYNKSSYLQNNRKLENKSVDNINIKINDLRSIENIKPMEYNHGSKINNYVENNIKINDLRNNIINKEIVTNNLVKDASYYVKLGKELTERNFN